MKYIDLINSQFSYGVKKKDILKKRGYDNILENVVIAPWWCHDIFENRNLKIEKLNDKVYNIHGNNLSFSFVELKRIGAPAIMDYILSLGLTKCKNLIFLGSAGSLDDDIKIGDIVVPKYSICGDGASRYLNDNFKDEFGMKEYPESLITNKLINILINKNINFYNVPNFSTDSLFGQFIHINEIKKMGAKTIEMETSVIFKCNELLNINMTAFFCISDNVVKNKSLYSGRSKKDDDYRHKIRYEIIPDIVIELFRK